MTNEEVQGMFSRRLFPPEAGAAVKLIQTHASWVMLTDRYAYKIKKPVRFSFLDFSTAEKREHFCREEVRLNRRLAPDMYLGVLPIVVDDHGFFRITTGKEKPACDSAVWMKRMDEQRQMDLLLSQNQIIAADLKPLASLLADFHKKHRLLKSAPYHPGDYKQDFDDLFLLLPAMGKWLGSHVADSFSAMKMKLHTFLDKLEPRITQRAQEGFWVDGHGDLHARNIFVLPDGPVVFDCIEFNEHYRRIDVLNELAFLCMDLRAKGHPEMADAFMEFYLQEWNCMETVDDERLFRYFKAYRANVRLKIDLLQQEQQPGTQLSAEMMTYFHVMMEEFDRMLVVT